MNLKFKHRLVSKKNIINFIASKPSTISSSFKSFFNLFFRNKKRENFLNLFNRWFAQNSLKNFANDLFFTSKHFLCLFYFVFFYLLFQWSYNFFWKSRRTSIEERIVKNCYDSLHLYHEKVLAFFLMTYNYRKSLYYYILLVSNVIRIERNAVYSLFFSFFLMPGRFQIITHPF